MEQANSQQWECGSIREGNLHDSDMGVVINVCSSSGHSAMQKNDDVVDEQSLPVVYDFKKDTPQLVMYRPGSA